MDTEKQKTVINEFIRQINKYKNLKLRVYKWPDEENRETEDVDALISSNHENIALEHTSIDVLPNQRKDDAIFLPVINGLEEELKKLLNYRVTIIIQSNSIKKGHDYNQLRVEFKSWLIENIPSMPFGMNESNDNTLPFKFKIFKEESGKNKIAIGRNIPSDNTFVRRLVNLLIKKSNKLQQYKKNGFKSILLIENNDIQLMSSDIMYEGLNDNSSDFNKNSVDEIWFADTAIENSYEFWLLNDINIKLEYPILLQ